MVRHTMDGHIRTFNTARKAFSYMNSGLYGNDLRTYSNDPMEFSHVESDMEDYHSSEVYVPGIMGYYVIERVRVY